MGGSFFGGGRGGGRLASGRFLFCQFLRGLQNQVQRWPSGVLAGGAGGDVKGGGWGPFFHDLLPLSVRRNTPACREGGGGVGEPA